MSKRSTAIIFMLISTISFSVMGAAVKYLTEVPLMQKIMVRNLVSLAVALGIARHAGKPLFGSSFKGRVLLLIRSILGLCGVALIFYATTTLSLTDSSLFMRLSPFWVTILAVIFLKEKIHVMHVPMLILAFLGTVIIMRPWENGADLYQLIPVLAGFIASLCAASAYTLVSKLKSYEDPSTIVFFFSFISVLIATPPALYTGYMPSFWECIGLIVIGLSAASGQMFLTHAYRLGGAAEVSIFSYAGILFSALLGFLLWGEIPDMNTIIGAAAIITAGWLIFSFGKTTRKS